MGWTQQREGLKFEQHLEPDPSTPYGTLKRKLFVASIELTCRLRRILKSYISEIGGNNSTYNHFIFLLSIITEHYILHLPIDLFTFFQGKLCWYPGANPTIAYYNTSAVKFYYATSSLVRFENEIIVFYFENRSSLLQRQRSYDWHQR
jgi:hypothetical protein